MGYYKIGKGRKCQERFCVFADKEEAEAQTSLIFEKGKLFLKKGCPMYDFDSKQRFIYETRHSECMIYDAEADAIKAEFTVESYSDVFEGDILRKGGRW